MPRTLAVERECALGDQVALLALRRENANCVIATLEGWISTSLVTSVDGSRVVIVSQWRDADAIKEMQADKRMLA